jgi:hypothetical protein
VSVVNLKIDGFSLAQQARITRRLEQKRRRFLRYADSVPNAKADPEIVEDVRREADHLNRQRVATRKLARSNHIAYCFLRTNGGVPFKAIEAKSFTQPDWMRIEALIRVNAGGDPRVVRQRFAEWLDDAGVNLTEVYDGEGKLTKLDDVSWKSAPPKPKRTRASNGAPAA